MNLTPIFTCFLSRVKTVKVQHMTDIQLSQTLSFNFAQLGQKKTTEYRLQTNA